MLQLWVCAILVIRKHFRRLPLLTAYIALNICQAVLLFFVYRYFGEPSEVGYVAGWWSEAVTVVARVFATAEVLRLALLSYRGIWGLAWRVLAGTSLAMSILAVVASRGDTDRALLNVDRGYHLIFATGIVACLLVIRYYQISVGRIYKTLLVTLCFYSCIKILINTVLQNFLSVHYMEFGVIWQVVSLFSYIAVLAIWAGALAHPLPAIEPQRAVLASSVYQRVSPEINSQLRAINGRLMSFFKIEERQP
ncbi:MAG: hypothetical protein M3P45_16395 [Acidobacteriota bacterium]|nr:hypothetical protein [Acidobacteriota bacterium]